MATKLDKAIKRELEIDGQLYTVIMSPEGLKITPKGGRKGTELSWRSLMGGGSVGGGMGGGGGMAGGSMGGGMGVE
ncbi:MAG TPA: hypothetical protein VK012_05540 [Gemmatimonadales bacterium]|nr:hypothetical protein [Gemmatimonadales bacterium]